MEKVISKFWDKTHELSDKLSYLFDRYVPVQGYNDQEEVNLFIAINKLVYDAYNNGWCNNMSRELCFLQDRGYLTEITIENLINCEYEQFGKLFDGETAKIINLLTAIESGEKEFTKMDGEDVSSFRISDDEFWPEDDWDEEDEEDWDESFDDEDDEDDEDE